VDTGRARTQGRRRRRTSGGQLLSSDVIVRTCLRLIEQHGAAALSMRRLGGALGADATAVYRYFPDKDALVLAVADELIGQSLAQYQPTGDWLADVRQLAELTYRTNLAYPRTTQLTAARVTGLRNEVRAVELLLGILRGAGFGATEAVRYYHCLVDLALAHSALDAGAQVVGATQPDAVWRDVYGTLPAASHPNIAASAGHLRDQLASSSFPATLELFLAALATRRRSAPNTAPETAQGIGQL
jgi:AcrR family transcriptional regulator